MSVDRCEVDRCEVCLVFVHQGRTKLQDGNFEAAEKLFRMAHMLAQSLLPEADLLPLTLYSLSWLKLKEGKKAESRELREQAAARLENDAAPVRYQIFHYLMATVLMKLGENHRAIQFWEEAMKLFDGSNPVELASMLSQAGLCYCQSGQREHAVIPLRAAVNIFRKCPGDPRLATTLITLGNALRKSSPAEAEDCYKEVAELLMAKGQHESATVAWNNLGVLCSKQGRDAESLEYYQQVLQVREASSRTPTELLGTALNNIANAHRRLKRFEEARQSIERAITLLGPDEGKPLAAAYGTRGLIFMDEGHDAEAVEWLQKAYAVREELPSPDLETVADDLEYEIAALRRLGWLEQLVAAEERLASVRAKLNSVPVIDRDLSPLAQPLRGAVLIEMDNRGRTDVGRKTDLRSLIERLSEALEREQDGFVAAKLVIPENTTLILNGADGEALFRAVEQILMGHTICQGAVVTIRQGDAHRTVVVPSLLT